MVKALCSQLIGIPVVRQDQAHVTCRPNCEQAFLLEQEMQREYKLVTDQEKEEVVQLGGLHVVGTERHEARRVDNQLRGRSGRYASTTQKQQYALADVLHRLCDAVVGIALIDYSAS